MTVSPAVPRRRTGERVALGTVLLAAAVLYLWRIDSVGWMNQYYTAVAQTSAASWRGLLFGSPDLTALTSTDKPPLAFWPMALSVRVLGLHPWSVALPQVLETLATAALLWATVRRVAGRTAGVLAAAAFALTPVVVVLARFDDPDTLLALLLTAAAYVTVRAVRSPQRRWLVALGVLIGAAFLTKWAAALVPVPALGAVLLLHHVGGHRSPARGLQRSAVVAAAAAAATAAWFVPVLLTPATQRPFPDSPTGSLGALVLGQDGMSRVLASGPVPASTIKGLPGLTRLLAAPFAGQIGWLLPAAALTLVVALVRWAGPRSRRVPPSDGMLLFGGWFVLAAGVLSIMGGAMHPYYTALLAPASAALVGMGSADAVRALRSPEPRWGLRAGLAVVVAALAAYAAWVLGPYPALAPWRPVVLIAAGVTVVALVAGGLHRDEGRVRRWPLALAAGSATVALAAGPTAFAASTLGHPVLGANPLAGPVETGTGHAPYNGALVDYLERNNPASARWLAAVVTSTAASELQLQTGRPVLPFGGFTGQSGFPAPDQVRTWVADGALRFIVLAGPYWQWHGGAQPPGMRTTSTAAVMTWAGQVGCIVTVPGGGYPVLDLAPTGPCDATAQHA